MAADVCYVLKWPTGSVGLKILGLATGVRVRFPSSAFKISNLQEFSFRPAEIKIAKLTVFQSKNPEKAPNH
jgi:hypothetical protein